LIKGVNGGKKIGGLRRMIIRKIMKEKRFSNKKG
jgi:hypothetical protein